MNLFSLLLFTCFIVYLYLGIYVFYLDRKAVMNITFFLLYLCFAFWSFAYSFMCSAPDERSCHFWFTAASIGYCMFPGFSLHFFLIYTKRIQILRKWWAYIVIYLPSLFFLYEGFIGDLFTHGFTYSKLGWVRLTSEGSPLLYAYDAFYIIYTLLGLLSCYLWQKGPITAKEAKQARIIIFSAVAALFCGSLLSMLPWAFGVKLPYLAPVGVIPMAVGTWYAIVKYRFLKLTPSLAAENILQTIVDSVALIDLEGNIVTANSETRRLLGYKEGELEGKPLEMLFPADSELGRSKIAELLGRGPIRNIETSFVSKDGAQLPVIFSASECRDSEGSIIGLVAVSRDITEMRAAEDRLKHIALYDTLTDLPNRFLLGEQIQQSIARADRSKLHFAVMLIDLDSFKEINDVYGHSNGDLLLLEVSKRLVSSVRESDIIARLGGDEFIILFNDLKKPGDCIDPAGRILKCFSEPFMVDELDIYTTASAGISIYPSDGISMDELVKNADLAMYNAKSTGKNNLQLFAEYMGTSVKEKKILENSLRKAIECGEFQLYYQPIVGLQARTITAVEALIRWERPGQGMVLPSKFIPIAEESGLIIPIGEWVLQTACTQMKVWSNAGFASISLSVNLSARQFQQQDLVDMITRILETSGLDPSLLLLEITESTAIQDLEHTTIVLKKLHDLGIKVVIDDFGIGYSSLQYLSKFPICAIKIDKLFIQDIASNPDSAAIVKAMLAMAHSMKLDVIAEGVESNEQLEILKSIKWDYVESPGCAAAQGYLFSHPVTVNAFSEILLSQKHAD